MNPHYRASSLSALAAAIAESLRGNIPKSNSGEKLSSLQLSGPLLILVPNHKLAQSLTKDLKFFLKTKTQFQTKVFHFPGWEMLPFETVSPAREISSARLEALYSLNTEPNTVVVSSAVAATQTLVSKKDLSSHILEISKSVRPSRAQLIDYLESSGYQRSSIVEDRGEYSVRGQVMDLFPTGSELPLRFEYFGEELESIRTFLPDDQRSLEELKEVKILPVREFLIPAGERRQRFITLLRERASDLDIPRSSLSLLENAVNESAAWPGLEQYLPLANDQNHTLFDYLGEKASVVSLAEKELFSSLEDHKELLSERVKEIKGQQLYVDPDSFWQSQEWFKQKLEFYHRHHFSVDSLYLSQEIDAEKIEILDYHPCDRLRTLVKARKDSSQPFKPVVEEIQRGASKGFDSIILASSAGRVERILKLLKPYGIEADTRSSSLHDCLDLLDKEESRFTGRVIVLEAEISQGLISLGNRYQLFAEQDIFPQIQSKKAGATRRRISRLLSGEKLFAEADHVVHADYGIGLYLGLREKEVEGKRGDYLLLEYANKAKLFVPVDHIGKVQKYVGIEGVNPRLSVLGGGAWKKARKKVEAKVASLAGELLELYAQRELVEGISFGAFGEDDRAFAEGFGFEETPDQEKAITEVLEDLAAERPMDRLICGDVGYGKTEVALRAAFKVASKGKQVALLVPTTILAAQHYKTFAARFSDFPINVQMVSRFNPTLDNKKIIAELALRKVDILIGTHRLLQRDVVFPDLGLLIIDEEHRFGVAHKEKLKNLRKSVDVLTMTATPIPRTLQMSMLDIRDLSIIETPPTDRQVIRTFLVPDEDRLIKEAASREMARDGQIFFVHNRVQSIDGVAARLRELLPEARIAVGHGQMKEKELELVMKKFLDHEVDILLATTIVESGLDFPNANTIIIDRADMFGLAQLYQLRGRVGRSSRRAYAYLLTSGNDQIGEAAKRRLQVLQALDDLGVGFRLALQDMEIRGAGNLLGSDQSGSINSIGFEMYTKILKDAVIHARKRLREDSQDDLPDIEPEVSIGFPAYIPRDYIPDVSQRLLLYQRLVGISGLDQGRELAEEIADRFGQYSSEVETLIELMVFRAKLKAMGIAKASFRDGVLSLGLHPDAPVKVETMVELVSKQPERYRLNPQQTFFVSTEYSEVQSPLLLLEELESLEHLLGKPEIGEASRAGLS